MGTDTVTRLLPPRTILEQRLKAQLSRLRDVAAIAGAVAQGLGAMGDTATDKAQSGLLADLERALMLARETLYEVAGAGLDPSSLLSPDLTHKEREQRSGGTLPSILLRN